MKKKRKIKFKNIIFLIVLIYIFASMAKQKMLLKELNAKKMDLQDEIHHLEEDVNDLEEDIAESNTVDFIEKTARDELGMVKPREIIYVDKNKEKNKK